MRDNQRRVFSRRPIADREGLFEGTRKFAHQVKLRPKRDINAPALVKLIETA
jgi:hypothetical protein